MSLYIRSFRGAALNFNNGVLPKQGHQDESSGLHGVKRYAGRVRLARVPHAEQCELPGERGLPTPGEGEGRRAPAGQAGTPWG